MFVSTILGSLFLIVSKEDALTWIAAHKWLTLPVAAKNYLAPESNE